MAFWNSFTDIGITPELPFEKKSRIRITNLAIILSAILTGLYFFFELIAFPHALETLQDGLFYTFHISVLLLCPLVLALNRYGYYGLSRTVLILFSTALCCLNSYMIHQPFRTEQYLFVIAAFIFIGFVDLKFLIPLFILATVMYAFLAWNVVEHNPELALVKQGLVFRTFIPFILLFFILYFLQAESGLYRDQLEEKNQTLLEDRNEKEKLNYTKDKIFSIISHDLRSPMASLHAMLDLLRSSHLSKEEFNKATAGIDSQVSILRNSLDELLTWSKAQLHGINPEPVTIEIKTLALDLVRQHRTLARKKQLFVHSEIAEVVYVCMDKNMLTSAMNNLLTNAIKFTPRKGAIHIRSRIKDNFAHLIVEDTGIGIEPENVSKILNPTELFTTRGTENEKGTGLGLSMISEFMNRNGGKLCIESVHKSGSRFTLVIPLA